MESGVKDMDAEQAKAMVILRPFSEGRGPIQSAWDGLATKLESEIGAKMMDWRKKKENFRHTPMQSGKSSSPVILRGGTRHKVALILSKHGSITARGACDYSAQNDKRPLNMAQIQGAVLSMMDAGLSERDKRNGSMVYGLTDAGKSALEDVENSA